MAQLNWDKKVHKELKTRFVFFKIDKQTQKKYLLTYDSRKTEVFLIENETLKAFDLEVPGKVLQIHNDLVYISAKSKDGRKNIYETKLKAR